MIESSVETVLCGIVTGAAVGTVLCTGTAVGTVLCGIVTGTAVGTVTILCGIVTGTVLRGIECCICLYLNPMQKIAQKITMKTENMPIENSFGIRTIATIKPSSDTAEMNNRQ